jgi:hypothetical protein
MLGVVLMGAGLVAIGGGATLLVLDKRQNCARMMAGDQCDERTRTHVPGWILVGAGALAGTVGGVVFYRTSSAELALGLGPSSVLLNGRF